MSPGGYAAGGGGKQGQTISMPGSQPGQQQFGRRPQTPPGGKEYDEESGALNPDTPMGGVKFGTSNAERRRPETNIFSSRGRNDRFIRAAV